MRSVKYLNGVLTVIAVLLTLNLWTAWTASPSGEVMSLANDSRAAGVGSGAEIQKKSLEQLKKIQRSVDSIDDMLDYGKATVKVEGLNDDMK